MLPDFLLSRDLSIEFGEAAITVFVDCENFTHCRGIAQVAHVVSGKRNQIAMPSRRLVTLATWQRMAATNESCLGVRLLPLIFPEFRSTHSPKPSREDHPL